MDYLNLSKCMLRLYSWLDLEAVKSERRTGLVQGAVNDIQRIRLQEKHILLCTITMS